MREIKFRAWDTKGKKCLNLRNYCIVPDVHGVWFLRTDKGHQLVERYELMQFTGLHDKNGKEIYEGDLLKWPEPEQAKGRVVWSDIQCSWMVQRSDYRQSLHSFAYPLGNDGLCRFKIIGNIYEDGNLLK